MKWDTRGGRAYDAAPRGDRMFDPDVERADGERTVWMEKTKLTAGFTAASPSRGVPADSARSEPLRRLTILDQKADLAVDAKHRDLIVLDDDLGILNRKRTDSRKVFEASRMASRQASSNPFGDCAMTSIFRTIAIGLSSHCFLPAPNTSVRKRLLRRLVSRRMRIGKRTPAQRATRTVKAADALPWPARLLPRNPGARSRSARNPLHAVPHCARPQDQKNP